MNHKTRSSNPQKPVSVRVQLDMNELLEIIYSEGTKTIEDLEFIMTKSRSSIYRLLRGMQIYGVFSLCSNETNHTYLRFTNKLSEKALKRAFTEDSSTPLVFIFLMGVLRAEEGSYVRFSEIEEWLGCSAKEAVRVRNLLISNIGIGEFELDDNDPWWDVA